MFIYGIDIAKSGSKTAWVKIDSQGNIVAKNSSTTNLTKEIYDDLLNKKVKIAIGFEAPMWVPVPRLREVMGQIQFSMKARFEVETEKSSQIENARGYEWYQGVASSASMKAIVVGNTIFKNNVPLKVTKDIEKWDDEYPLLVYEGYCAGRFKPKQFYGLSYFANLGLLKDHEIDAFVVATACLYGINHKIIPFTQFKEHLSVVCSDDEAKVTQNLTNITSKSIMHKSIEHSDIVCLWDIIFKGNVIGTKACSVYGFSFQ
jgi:hypothetical protein